MSETAKPADPASVRQDLLVMPLTLDIALIRWSVVCASWGELSAGHAPNLQAFLAGWCCRVIGASMPSDVGILRESFRVGWREADCQVEIAARHNSGMSDAPLQ